MRRFNGFWAILILIPAFPVFAYEPKPLNPQQQEVFNRLYTTLRSSTDTVQRRNASDLLGEIVEDRPAFFQWLLGDQEETVREVALRGLLTDRDPSSVTAVIDVLRTGPSHLRSVARTGLTREWRMPEGLLQGLDSAGGDSLPNDLRASLEEWIRRTCETLEEESLAALRFEVLEAETDRMLPARIQVFRLDAGPPSEGTSLEREADEHVVFSAQGKGKLRLPPGDYEFVASRGAEYALDRIQVHLRPGSTISAVFVLARCVETPGSLSARFRVSRLGGNRTATSYGSILSRCVAEGIEFAVSSERGVIADLPAVAEAHELDDRILTAPGCLIENSYLGAFNVFPAVPEISLPGWGAPVPTSDTAAGFFAGLGDWAGDAILQVVGPRKDPGGYFNTIGLSMGSGLVGKPELWLDFNLLDVAIPGDESFPSQAMTDWFHLLNHGYRIGGIAGRGAAGWGTSSGLLRTYVTYSSDDLQEPKVESVVEAVQEHRLTVSNGAIIRVEGPDGSAPGSLTSTNEAILEIDVRAAPWVDVRQAETILNGRVVEKWEIPPSDKEVRFLGTKRYRLSRDTWIVVRVSGERIVEAGVPGSGSVPFAFTNPFYFDADGDGRFTGPYQELEEDFLARLPDPGFNIWIRSLPAEDRVFLIENAARKGVAPAYPFVKDMLKSTDADVRLAAIRASGVIPAEEVRDLLWDIYRKPISRIEKEEALGQLVRVDRPAAMRELTAALSSDTAPDRLSAIRTLGRFGEDTYVRDWHYIGPFDNPGLCCMDAVYSVEGNTDLNTVHPGIDGAVLSWKPVQLTETPAWVDFTRWFGRPNYTMAYALARFEAPREGSYHLLAGSDDGIAVWINGIEVLRHEVGRAAEPGQEHAVISLQKGSNEMLVKVSQHINEWRVCVQILDPQGELAFPVGQTGGDL